MQFPFKGTHLFDFVILFTVMFHSTPVHDNAGLHFLLLHFAHCAFSVEYIQMHILC